MNKRTMLTVLMASTALAACGGGGARPQPTPTPPPTSTPAPTPTPPPPSGNTSLADLQVSENFTNDGTSETANYPTTGAFGTASAAPAAISVSYNATTRSYTISTAGRSQTFGPGDLTSAPGSSATVYERTSGTTTDSLTLTPPGTSGPLRYTYVSGGFWQRTTQSTSSVSASFDAFAYGVETPDAAIPRSGGGVYLVDLLGVAAAADQPYPLSGSGRIDVNFGSGSLSLNATGTGTGLVDNRFQAFVTLTGTAQLSSTANSFTGPLNITGFPGPMSGSWSGRFYGPQAQEIGASFAANATTGSGGVAGVLIGRSATSGGGETLATLTAPRTFTTLPTSEFRWERLTNLIPPIHNASGDFGSMISFTVDPQAGTFTMGGTEATPNPTTFSDNDRLASESGGRFTVYRRALGDRTATLRLYRPTAGTGEVALSYASFGIFEVERPNQANDRFQNNQYFFDYGLRTAPNGLPRIGNAVYTAALAGTLGSGLDLYRLGGTGELDFNLANAVFTGTLRPTATHMTTGAPLTLASWSVTNGRISFDDNSFSSMLLPGGQPGQPFYLNGRFYGPTGQEIGATFYGRIAEPSGNTMPVAGALVGRRN